MLDRRTFLRRVLGAVAGACVPAAAKVPAPATPLLGYGTGAVGKHYRDLWRVQVLRRYNEAIAADYAIPFSVERRAVAEVERRLRELPWRVGPPVAGQDTA
jgi:hypothetical protein